MLSLQLVRGAFLGANHAKIISISGYEFPLAHINFIIQLYTIQPLPYSSLYNTNKDEGQPFDHT